MKKTCTKCGVEKELAEFGTEAHELFYQTLKAG
jgi:hypothetical protein